MMCQKPSYHTAFLTLTLNSHWPSVGYLKIKLDLDNSYQVIWFDTGNGDGILICTDLLRTTPPKKLIQK